MSVQLIVYPQSYDGFSNSNNPTTQMLSDGNDFVNVAQYTSSYGNPVATLSQQAVSALYPMYLNTWYAYYNSVSGGIPSGTSDNAVIYADSGILQNVTNLTAGLVYNLEITYYTGYNYVTNVKIFNQDVLTSSQIITPTGLVETIQFTAPSSNDTIVAIDTTESLGYPIVIKSISVIAAPPSPSGAIQLLGDGQVIVDLYEDEDLPLTLSVDDFKNVAEKVQSYSKAFNLPATKRNNKIFNSLFEVTRSDDGMIFNVYKKTQCVLKQDGFILFEGYLRLLDVTDKEGEISYNVNLYSEVVALADTLKDRAFRDLDFTELEHLYNYTNISLSASNSTSVDYINSGTSGFRDNSTVKYPFVDWSHQIAISSTGNPELPSLETAFRPWLNIKYLIDKIFEETNFTYESEFFNEDDFKNLYMDFNWGSGVNPNTTTNSGIAKYKSLDPNNYATTSYSDFHYIDVNIPSAAGFDDSTNVFTCPVGQENSTFNIDYSATVIAQRNADIEFRWVKNLGLSTETIINQSPLVSVSGSAVATVTFATFGQGVDTITIQDGGYYTTPPTVTIPNSMFGAGATFTAILTGTSLTDIDIDMIGGGYGDFDQLVFNGVNATFNYNGSISETMQPSDTLQLQWKSSDANRIRQMNSPYLNNVLNADHTYSYIIPSVTILGVTGQVLLQTLRGELGQWEFLKGLITMFNLVTLPDEDNPNNIKIEPYSDVFITPSLTTPPLDWTDRIDTSEMKLTPLADLNKKTIFKFVEDDDDFAFNNYKNSVGGHLYGSKKYNAGNEFNILEGEDEIVAEPFAATVIKPLMNFLPNFVTPAIYSMNDDVSEGFENSPRIMYNNGIKNLGSSSYSVPAQNGVAGNDTENEYLSFSHITNTGLSISGAVDFHFGVCQLLTDTNPTLNNLYGLYWGGYYNELYNPNTRTMTIKVNLTPADINTFKFNDTVMIKNRVFRVNKIDYKPNDLATVEFILIP